ncbi:diguanylate cyclase domain-containing protein [Noviherbaspirillum saxi]|uniref:Diguanylate cyclase n=1 Tax=Noviherbaspirillum saxi TaxID=2320863 RepID=A0A3A3GAP3_9BURK|nr:diguanylate cyclase [Noviherbaspirillum saxi]RJF99255.1 diguanylate cyclase [Noviherbaspirillum saxi]
MPSDSSYNTPFDTSTFIIPEEWHAFSDLLGGADTGLLFLREGVIVHANATLTGQLGFTEDELAGQPVETLVAHTAGTPHTETEDGSRLLLQTKGGMPKHYLLIANRIDTLSDAGCVIWVLQPVAPTTQEEMEETAQGLSDMPHLADHLPDLVAVCTPDFAVRYANRSYRELVGEQSADLGRLIHDDDRPRALEALRQSTPDGHALSVSFRLRRHDGIYRHVVGEVRNLQTQEEIGGFLLNVRDVTDDVHRQHDLESEKKRQLHYLNRLLRIAQHPHANFSSALKVILKSAVKALSTHRCAYWDVHADPEKTRCMLAYDETRQNYVEEQLNTASGASLHPLLQRVQSSEHQLVVTDVDQDPRVAVYCEYFHANAVKALIAMPVQHGDGDSGVLVISHVGEARAWRRDESEFAEAVAGVIALILKEVERVRIEAQAKHFARHDRLTGLPNRDSLLDQAKDIFPKMTTKANTLAAFFIDLDGFKEVNDTLGKDIGDELLKASAMRLRNVVRKNDIIARLGGDEFVLLAINLSDMRIADDIATQLVDTMRGAFSVGGQKVQISASVGIALYPFDGTDLETLMKKADIALVEAKRSGRDQYRMFRPQLNDSIPPAPRSGRN